MFCSGIGAPENASQAICKALEHFLGGTVKQKNLWACDVFAESRYELQLLPDPPECIFEDITDIIDQGIRLDLKKAAPRMACGDLIRLFFDDDGLVRPVLSTTSWCSRHRRHCALKKARLHIAGTPCVAWAKLGLRCGATGASALFFVWLAHRLMLKEDAILHEHVPGFDVYLLNRFLGKDYIIMSCVVSNASLGQLVERERRFTWLLNRNVFQGHAAMPLSWGCDFLSLFHRELDASCAEFWDLSS